MGFPNIMIEGFAGRSLGETPTVSGLIGGAFILTAIVSMVLLGSVAAKKKPAGEVA